MTYFKLERIAKLKRNLYSSVIVCDEPSGAHGGLVVCKRESATNNRCADDSTCTFSYFEVSNQICPYSCIAIGWLGYSAKYYHPDNSVMRETCDSVSETPTLPPSLTTISTNNPAISTRSAAQTDTSDCPNCSSSHDTVTMVLIGVGVGCSLLAIIFAAFFSIYIFFKKRRKANLDAVRLSDLQPYALSGDGVGISVSQGEGHTLAHADRVTSGGEGDEACAVYSVADRVYCTIAGDGQTWTHEMDSLKNDRGFCNGLHHKGHTDKTSDSADMIIDQRTPQLGSHGRDNMQQVEEERGVNVYSRVDNGRRDIPEHISTSVLETYNTSVPFGAESTQDLLEPYSVPKSDRIWFDNVEENNKKEEEYVETHANVYSISGNRWREELEPEEISASMLETYKNGVPVETKTTSELLEPYSVPKSTSTATDAASSTTNEAKGIYHLLQSGGDTDTDWSTTGSIECL